MDNYIYVNGARENNLQNISVKIPHGKHTVIVGVSGSGKSTLAYDVIYAAGQKRLLDCLSDAAKHYTSRLKQPDVNFIDGLTPVISVKQAKANINPRSTIGTLSELSTYMRYLFSAMGEVRCPVCQKNYPMITLQYIIKKLEDFSIKTNIEIQFPIYKSRTEKYEDFFSNLRKKGYKKIEIDGQKKDFRDWIEISNEPKSMYVVAGIIETGSELTRGDINLLKSALLNGNGFLRILNLGLDKNTEYENLFKGKGCSEHGMLTADVLPSFFSFNDPESGCDECKGTGITKVAIPDVIVQNRHKSLRQGPFYPLLFLDMKKPYDYCLIYSLSKHYKFSFDEPFECLPDFAKDIIFYGTKGEKIPFMIPENYNKELPLFRKDAHNKPFEFEGLLNSINRYYIENQNRELAAWEDYMFNNYMIDEQCQSCKGSRLKPHRQFIEINGMNFHALGDMELTDLHDFLSYLSKSCEKEDALQSILNEIMFKLNALIDIGLGYLSLNRRIDTLSGGEYQRVRLAGQLGCGLTGLTYIIDEPTAGLHSCDNVRISKLIEKLCQKGNTVITIEHDLDIIKSADHIIEVGPDAGVNGGRIIAEGSLSEILNNKKSVISTYLKRPMTMNKNQLDNKSEDIIKVIGAKSNNLKDIDVSIPLNKLVCFTGISGSGKSSLVIETIYKAFWSNVHNSRIVPGKHTRIEGMEKITDVYCIDQSSIRSSKTSIPATYIGVFDSIRKIFSESEDAVKKGLNHISHYSFNSTGGCLYCKGIGYLDTHIPYLGDLNVVCPVCNGKRYQNEVLEVYYNGKNISEILNLTIESALGFFSEHVYIHNKLSYLSELGLEYITLGQSINTISGGESQRLRLAKELSKIRKKKNMLYILDEPTTGLHSKDVAKLLKFINNIVEKGNSVFLIEHNPEVIMNSDYIIDLGPGAGENGGKIIAEGSIFQIMECKDSITGQYLKSSN